MLRTPLSALIVALVLLLGCARPVDAQQLWHWPGVAAMQSPASQSAPTAIGTGA
ncbi:M23 family peptidase, partial [Xanthomonas oryzae pv. oryzae]